MKKSARIPRTERLCLVCDKPFLAYKIGSHWCSWACWRKAHTPIPCTFICSYCQNEFTREWKTAKRPDRAGLRRFCSFRCMGLFRKSKLNPMNRGYAEIKGYRRLKIHKAWSKHGFVVEPLCAVCGKKGHHQDHIISVSTVLKMEWPLEIAFVECNRMTLCRTDHGRKGAADWRMWDGDVLGFEEVLRTSGWPMERVWAAMAHYKIKSTQTRFTRSVRATQ